MRCGHWSADRLIVVCTDSNRIFIVFLPATGMKFDVYVLLRCSIVVNMCVIRLPSMLCLPTLTMSDELRRRGIEACCRLMIRQTNITGIYRLFTDLLTYCQLIKAFDMLLERKYTYVPRLGSAWKTSSNVTESRVPPERVLHWSASDSSVCSSG